MPAPDAINTDKLQRLLGTPRSPAIIDVRSDDGFAADARLIPSARRRAAAAVADWGKDFAGQAVVVVCADGRAASQGVAAQLRHAGVAAEVLEGGTTAWADAGAPFVRSDALPPRDASGRTVWVTRARPKIDRIACPWLIRRFVDPAAIFLYVAAAEVAGVAEQFNATPFDVDGIGSAWSHDGERCTFDAMVEGFGLANHAPLQGVAAIVRGADTGRLNIAPESAGLLAISLGLSRMFTDDLQQLEAGMSVYDALYRWRRDATGETHDRSSHQSRPPRRP